MKTKQTKSGWKCPKCGQHEIMVTHSETSVTGDSVIRRRKCMAIDKTGRRCGYTFYTVEK